jgi:hypothetical protein
MKAVLAMIAYFSVAVTFGILLVRTKLSERVEYQGIDEDERPVES